MSRGGGRAGDERQRPARRGGVAQRRHRLGHAGHDLVLAHHAHVQVGHQRQPPRALTGATVEDERPGRGDGQRAAGDHAVDRVQLLDGQLGLLDQLEAVRQPRRARARALSASRRAPWRAATAATASATPPRLDAGDRGAEVLDPLGQQRGGVVHAAGSRSYVAPAGSHAAGAVGHVAGGLPHPPRGTSSRASTPPLPERLLGRVGQVAVVGPAA